MYVGFISLKIVGLNVWNKQFWVFGIVADTAQVYKPFIKSHSAVDLTYMFTTSVLDCSL